MDTKQAADSDVKKDGSSENVPDINPEIDASVMCVSVPLRTQKNVELCGMKILSLYYLSLVYLLIVTIID